MYVLAVRLDDMRIAHANARRKSIFQDHET